MNNHKTYMGFCYSQIKDNRCFGKRVFNFSVVIISCILVFVILLPISPIYQLIPNRDSSVFLYIGDQIIEGQIPYSDLWDHKGPLIYFINSLGLFIGHGSIWGVWILEFIFIFISAIVGYRVLSLEFGTLSSIIGSITWLVCLGRVIDGGNLTEEYSLPFQFICMYLFWLNFKQRPRFAYYFLIGVLLVSTALLRPNNIGIFIAAIAILVFTYLKPKQLLRSFYQFSAVFAGILFVTLITLAYLFYHDSLVEYIDQYITYNLFYSFSDFSTKIFSFFYGFEKISFGISIIVLVTWIGSVHVFLRYSSSLRSKPLILLAIIGLPVEIFLSSLTGRTYDHYYIVWLPIYAILITSFVDKELIKLPQLKTLYQKIWSIFLLLLLVGSIIMTLFGDIKKIITLSGLDVYENEILLISETIRDEKNANYLLVWGAEPVINFLSETPAPTRYFYQYPLFTPGYQNNEMLSEFLIDIQEKKPLIIDTSSTNPVIPPIDEGARRLWLDSDPNYELLPEMNLIFEYLMVNYRLTQVYEISNWKLYEYNEE